MKRLDRRALYGNARATLRPERIDDSPSAGGLHANQEAVGFLAARDGGLVSSFHEYSRQWEDKFWRARYTQPKELRIIVFFHTLSQEDLTPLLPGFLARGSNKTPRSCRCRPFLHVDK